MWKQFGVLRICVQTVEYFAWNVRVLKGQADLLRHAQNTCCEDMKQVCLQSQSHCVVVAVRSTVVHA